MYCYVPLPTRSGYFRPRGLYFLLPRRTYVATYRADDVYGMLMFRLGNVTLHVPTTPIAPMHGRRYCVVLAFFVCISAFVSYVTISRKIHTKYLYLF